MRDIQEENKLFEKDFHLKNKIFYASSPEELEYTSIKLALENNMGNIEIFLST